MTTPMSLQSWWWQIFILIQLWSQFFQMFVYSDVVYAQKTWYWPWKTVSSHLHMPAYVFAIWPSFLFDSFVKIWETCEIFLGKWFTAPPWQKNSRTPMVVNILYSLLGGAFNMTPGKCTVVELNLFRHRQPNSRDEGIFKFCHQLCKAKLGDWTFEESGIAGSSSTRCRQSRSAFIWVYACFIQWNLLV